MMMCVGSSWGQDSFLDMLQQSCSDLLSTTPAQALLSQCSQCSRRFLEACLQRKQQRRSSAQQLLHVIDEWATELEGYG